MLKRVLKEGLNNFKQHWLTSYVLIFVAIVFLCSGVAISLNTSFVYLSLFFILFISLPILFAVIVSIYGYRKNIESLKWGNILRYSLSYFKQPFRGAFRVISTFLWFLVCFMLFETLFSSIAYNALLNLYPNFNDTINELYSILNSGNITGLESFLVAHAGEFNAFQYLTIAPALILSIAIASLYSFYNLYQTYFLINFPLANLIMSRICFRNAKIQARRTMMKYYLSFSWVFALLLIGGYAGSLTVCYFNSIAFHYANIISLIIGLSLSLLYLPLFLSFNESLFIENINFYDPNKNNSADLIMNQLNAQIKQYGEIVNQLEKEKDKLDKEQGRQDKDQS